MKKPIVLIKIGGSLITDKSKPFTLREQALKKICQEIKKVYNLKNKLLVIGHGAGSFAHLPAKKYGTINGVHNQKEVLGMARVCEVACRLNRIVVDQLLSIGLPAVSVSPLSSFLSSNFQLKQLFSLPVDQLLNMGALPIFYGDVILDETKGCTIYSTEQILSHMGKELVDNGFQVERIIHCGQTNGVYDQNGATIPLINKSNFKIYEKNFNGSGGIDVTGGMLHKVQASLALAKSGIPALIIDGIGQGSLLKAIKGEKVLGTKIEW